MLDKLQALTNREAGDLWRVENGSIVKYSGNKHRVQNLVDFVRSIKLASQEAKTLTTDEVEQVTIPLLEVAFSLQERISKLPAWRRLFLNVVQYLSTGTTLQQETNSFVDLATTQKQVNPRVLAKAQCPQLFKDAEYARTCRAAYNEIAKKYKLSQASQEATLLPLQILTNPLLVHLRQASLSSWLKMRDAIRTGKSLEDPEVMRHAQSALALGSLLVELAVSHELENVYERRNELIDRGELGTIESTKDKKEQLGIMLRNQSKYSFWALLYFGRLYTSIRSNPILGADSQLVMGNKENPALIQQFYQAGTPANFCRLVYNDCCDAIEKAVDMTALNLGEKLDFIQGHKATSPDRDMHWLDNVKIPSIADLPKSLLDPNW